MSELRDSGPLRAVLRQAMAQTGLKMGDLSIQSPSKDPYRRVDTGEREPS